MEETRNAGSRIRAIRILKGITQEELARKSGVSRATISALENGQKVNVMWNTLVSLARALESAEGQNPRKL